MKKLPRQPKQYQWLLFFCIVSSSTASHISPCGRMNLTEHSGIIQSPNFPKPYPSQVECEWIIQSSSQTVVKLEILVLDLYLNCTQHWVSIPYEGGRGTNHLCGDKAPEQPITVVQPTVSIKYFSSEVKKESRGFKLRYTVEPEACAPHDVHCRSGGCVKNSSRCNGVKDCDDGSDETGCAVGSAVGGSTYPMGLSWSCEGTIPCQSSPNRCYFLGEQKCDGEFSCPRGDDEVGCAPGCPNRIACSSGEGCYDTSQRCNGVLNCRDNSDETDCAVSGCGPLEFVCRSGGCVPAAALCDGIDDCGDLSDELHCAKYSLLALATVGLLACVFVSCVGLSYRLYTVKLRASTSLLQQLDPEVLEDGFIYGEPPPSYAVAVGETHPLSRVAPIDSPPRRQRRRQRRRRPAPELRTPVHPVHTTAKPSSSVTPMEPQWRSPQSSPSMSPSRESVTSSTSIDDLLQ